MDTSSDMDMSSPPLLDMPRDITADMPPDMDPLFDLDEGLPDMLDLGDDLGTLPHPTHSETWCERVQSAPDQDPSSRAVQLSRAHASVRFFGVHTGYEDVDAALSESLRTWNDPDTMPDLTHYNERLTELCLLTPDATPLPIPTTQVEMRGGVAFVTPGAQAPIIPDEAEAIVLDWRALPDHAQLDAHLRASLGAALAEDFQPSSFNVRQHRGMADEVFAPGQSIYTRSVASITPPLIPARATTRRPIAVWIDITIPARVAQLAGALRLQGRAALLGEPISASMAESSTRWIGDVAVIHRTRDMLSAERQRWPDFIGNDAHVWAKTQVLELWNEQGFDVTELRGLSLRPRLERLDTPDKNAADTTLHPGVMRAGLLTSHGAFDLFFGYFDEVGRQVDVALPELLAEIDSSTPTPARATYHELLLRLMYHLHDAHCFLNDLGVDQSSYRANSRFLPIRLAYVEERPVVDWSDEPLLQPGDEVLAMNGQPASALLESWSTLVPAATRLNALMQMGLFFLFQQVDTVSMRIRHTDGSEESIDVPTRTSIDQAQINRIVGLRFPRASGWLTDLGAPNVLYINLDRSVMNTRAHVTQLYDEIDQASAIILDMRGYPGTWDVFQIAGAVVGHPYDSPQFRVPIYQGTDAFTLDQSGDTYPGSPVGVSFSGRAALLVGPGTQSFAENFSMGLVTEQAVDVFGEQSSGTNGNITGLVAPGGFTVTFTGMNVRYADGALFHGHGIVPDVPVTRSLDQIASGEDTVLRRALDHLMTPP